MFRSVLSKVAWVGRTASMVFGLALVLGLLFGVASMAFAANGQSFILGSLKNSATAVSKLTMTGTASGPVLQLVQQSTGAGASGLGITVPSGKAPLTVNSAAGKATNLDADKIDSLDSTQLQRRVSGTCAAGQSISAIGVLGTVTCETDDDSGVALRSDLVNSDANGPNEPNDPVSYTKVKDIPQDVVSRNADTLDGQNSTDFAAATHNHDSSYIQESPGSAEQASIYIDGTMRTSGMLRTGSETGTSDNPLPGSGQYDGLVIRRAKSSNLAAGEVVARTDELRLERDGTSGGLRLAWTAPVDTDSNLACTGVTAAGTPVGRSFMIGAQASPVAVFTHGQNVVYYSCSFGNPYSDGHVTQVTMQRREGDWYWVGTITSSVNQ